MTAKSNIKTRNFTLVELLVVIVIISIILSMTAPAFRRIMVGNSVDSAARMVSSQLMLARAEAIAKRRYVAVIMPSDINVPSSDSEVYKLQAFRSGYVTGSGTSWTLEEWVPGTQWTFLPTGALIARIDNDHKSIELEQDPDDSSKKVWVPTKDWSNGSNFEGEGYSTVVDGSKDDDDDPETPPKAISIIDNATNDSGIRAIVFKPNGRAVRREYITVMEGVCDANNADIERANEKNINVIEVNEYTGQARYIYTGK